MLTDPLKEVDLWMEIWLDLVSLEVNEETLTTYIWIGF